jgi:hypothetical protein
MIGAAAILTRAARQCPSGHGSMRGVVIGIGLGVATIGIAALLSERYALDLLACVLAAIATIYAGLALADARRSSLGVEVGVALVFIVLAAAGRWFSPLVLAAAYAAHGAWDAIHHRRGIQTRIPSWYPPLCLAYDVVVAGFIALEYGVLRH